MTAFSVAFSKLVTTGIRSSFACEQKKRFAFTTCPISSAKLRNCGVGLKAYSSADIASAASARSRRTVACIDLATAAIDGDSASVKRPSGGLRAVAGTDTVSRQSDNSVIRSMGERLLEFAMVQQ